MGNQYPIDGQSANQTSGSNENQVPQNQPDGFILFMGEFLKLIYPAKGF
jgi:hypothetical protein